MPLVAIANRSSVMSDAEVSMIACALQVQVTRDFAPLWGTDAALKFFGKKDKVPVGYWTLAVLDTSDVANALGYHDVTRDGLPLGKAFAKSDIDNKLAPSVTISHELLEMLGDPDINLCAQVGNKIYSYEACDPCEADAYGYEIDGVAVSDFVTPAWFMPKAKGPFDFMKKIKKPLSLLPGGYLQYLDIGGGHGWQQVTADRASAATRPQLGSRRERRRVPHEQRQRSTR